MTIPTYIAITDDQVAPEAPMTTGLMTQLRDNMISVIQGGPNAPRMGPGLLSIGGSGGDGLISAGPSWASAGFYDYTGGITDGIFPADITANPGFLWVRVLGDVTLAHTITLKRSTAQSDATLQALGCLVGGSSGDAAVTGGGGSYGGAGGGGVGGSTNSSGGVGVGIDATAINRWWAMKRAIVGGWAGTDGDTHRNGGAGFIFMVDGNLDCTGGTIDCSGENGAYGDFGSAHATGGGGGGSIYVICSGTITNGTYKVNGGNGGSGSPQFSGCGSGGYIALIASAFAGTQTTSAAAGSGGSGGGGAGLVQTATLTNSYINSFIWR